MNNGEAPLERRFLGVVEVDSGTLLIGDPTYSLPRAEEGRPGIDYAEVIGVEDSAHAVYLAGPPVLLVQTAKGRKVTTETEQSTRVPTPPYATS